MGLLQRTALSRQYLSGILLSSRRKNMSEHSLIDETPEPRTRASLGADLRALGVTPGMTLIVHSSLSSLGWVCGGPVAVVQALLDVVTPKGTLVMPTQSGDLSDPANWSRPPVPSAWLPTLYEHMPAYDPHLTPTRGMGRIVEVFRTWPGAIRSAHPLVSLAAWGAQAERIIQGHQLDYGLGEGSPLARMYELDGHVLLLGAGYDSNTTFHLAEYRAPGQTLERQGAPIMENGQRVWKTYDDIELDADIFPAIGADFEATGAVTVGQVGSAQTRLFSSRAAVDFAQAWLTKRRS
jgi:aminoglycoside 3-N-acetyltransferase